MLKLHSHNCCQVSSEGLLSVHAVLMPPKERWEVRDFFDVVEAGSMSEEVKKFKNLRKNKLAAFTRKLLNFTEIHREYYKNFHFQLGLIPSTSCDLDNL